MSYVACKAVNFLSFLSITAPVYFWSGIFKVKCQTSCHFKILHCVSLICNELKKCNYLSTISLSSINNNFSIKGDALSIFSFPQLPEILIFTVGLLESDFKQDPHVAFG